MRRFVKWTLRGFAALVVGAIVGQLWDETKPPELPVQKDRARIEHRPITQTTTDFDCLREALYYEAGRDLYGAEVHVGMVIMARVKDPDPQWPVKTVCGVVHQRDKNGYPYFSYWGDEKLMAQKIDPAAWARAGEIAQYLLGNAWNFQVMRRGAGCVRAYKMSDAKLAKLSAKAKEQLHITKKKGLGWFEKTQQLVFTLGDTSFYQDKGGCKHPLPSMEAAS